MNLAGKVVMNKYFVKNERKTKRYKFSLHKSRYGFGLTNYYAYWRV